MCEAASSEQPIALICAATKTCPRCNALKQVEEFPKTKGKFRGYCRECEAEYAKTRQEKNKAREFIFIPEIKTCPKCETEKSTSEFNRANGNVDGLCGWCKECESKTKKARHKNNSLREVVTIPEFKTCSTCKIEKAGFAFSKCKGKKDGLKACCKECIAISNIKARYGLSPEQFSAMLLAQGGACAICRVAPVPGDIRLCVDHIHGTEVVRGLLHSNCNRGLGFFNDSVDLIGKAIDYLKGPALGIPYKNYLPRSIKEKILIAQDYKCKICSVDLHNKKVCFDHDHLTNMIRGALCNNCNCGLGQFDDCVMLLQNAIVYLLQYVAE
jgi:hypothetical protein